MSHKSPKFQGLFACQVKHGEEQQCFEKNCFIMTCLYDWYRQMAEMATVVENAIIKKYWQVQTNPAPGQATFKQVIKEWSKDHKMRGKSMGQNEK